MSSSGGERPSPLSCRGRRFDDLFNFVHDPATLIVAFDRVADNVGSRTAGVDGLTVADVEQRIGVADFLDDLRTQLKSGTFTPLPVRERAIPKPGGPVRERAIPKPGGSGKVRKLGILTRVAYRAVWQVCSSVVGAAVAGVV
ncbi:MAG: hypothetical protein JO100_05580 [Pseudonocardia sp.]|nr:hypothetical protein [Pseudonocardia sp.]